MKNLNLHRFRAECTRCPHWQHSYFTILHFWWFFWLRQLFLFLHHFFMKRSHLLPGEYAGLPSHTERYLFPCIHLHMVEVLWLARPLCSFACTSHRGMMVHVPEFLQVGDYIFLPTALYIWRLELHYVSGNDSFINFPQNVILKCIKLK